MVPIAWHDTASQAAFLTNAHPPAAVYIPSLAIIKLAATIFKKWTKLYHKCMIIK